MKTLFYKNYSENSSNPMDTEYFLANSAEEVIEHLKATSNYHDENFIAPVVEKRWGFEPQILDSDVEGAKFQLVFLSSEEGSREEFNLFHGKFYFSTEARAKEEYEKDWGSLGEDESMSLNIEALDIESEEKTTISLEHLQYLLDKAGITAEA